MVNLKPNVDKRWNKSLFHYILLKYLFSTASKITYVCILMLFVSIPYVVYGKTKAHDRLSVVMILYIIVNNIMYMFLWLIVYTHIILYKHIDAHLMMLHSMCICINNGN